MHAFHADINKRLSIVSAPSSMMSDALRKDSTLYVGAYELCSNSSDKYFFVNGYIGFERGRLDSYFYYAKDHLGNVRHVDRSTPGRDNGIVQITNYYPFGGILNESFNRVDYQNKLYNGKELDSMHGLNLYDFSARQYDPAIGQFTSMDPLCEKYYHISPYAYCAGNPVKYVDPDGKEWKDINGKIIDDLERVKVFIFYSSDFEEQAKVQYQDAVEKYGETSVAMSLAKSNDEFENDWENMSGTQISDVMIMTHGKNQSITLDNDQITSTGNGKTNISGSEALNVQDLPKPKGDVSNAVLHMYSCHSADKNPNARPDGVHSQGALKGTKEPIAYAFQKSFGFKYTIGTASSVNYNSWSNMTPSWSKKYMKPYPINGKWVKIRTAR